jgi:hypothetical protein
MQPSLERALRQSTHRHGGKERQVFLLRSQRMYDAIETGEINLNDLAPRIRELRERQTKPQGRKEE